MSDWIEWSGGPQPVDDDVWICVDAMPEEMEEVGAGYVRLPKQVGSWKQVTGFFVLNQHLIDAKQAEIDALRDDLETWQSVFPHVMPDRLKSDQQLADEDVAAKIDAARREGILLGLEAAAKVADLYSNKKVVSHIRWLQPDIIAAIQKPDTIAKEADNDPR